MKYHLESLPVRCLICHYDDLQMWPKMQNAERVLDMKPWVLDITLFAYQVLDRPLLHDASGWYIPAIFDIVLECNDSWSIILKEWNLVTHALLTLGESCIDYNIGWNIQWNHCKSGVWNISMTTYTCGQRCNIKNLLYLLYVWNHGF